jgi:putative thioredoxin
VAGSKWVVEVTMENFQEVVVEGSRERPVVIDFWAEWCGPCRRLAPMLEQAAEEMDGAFLLVKVNTDENPELAQAFQVEGIPAVFAIRDGKLVNHFTGVIPAEEFRAFLASLGPATPAEPTPLDRAKELEATDPAGALAAYRALFAEAPSDPAVRVGLARVLLASPGSESEAQELLTGVEFGDFAEEAGRLRSLVQLRGPSGGAPADQSSPQGKLAHAQALAAKGEYKPALDALLAAAEDDRELGRTAVRELMLKIFEVIGPRSEQATEYRKKLQGLLY